MATLSSGGTLPQWFVAEAYRSDDLFDAWAFRAGVRCQDGDLVVLDFPVVVRVSPGRSDRVSLTRRELLERMHEQVVTKLAKLALEDE